MAIGVDGFADWAVVRLGPTAKTYSNVNKMLGLVCHSTEGWLAGSFGELDKLNRAASWCFSVALDGTLYQHYPVWASCWASGNFSANTSLISVESEGVAGTPLNAAQVATMLRLGQDLEANRGWKLKRGVTLWEHNEVALWDTENAGPTACPSHRYDPYFAALEDDMGMTPAELARLERLEDLLAGNGIAKDLAKPDERTTGNDALEYAWKQGWSAFLGIGLVTQNLAVHELVDHDGTPGESVTVVIPGGKVLPS